MKKFFAKDLWIDDKRNSSVSFFSATLIHRTHASFLTSNSSMSTIAQQTIRGRQNMKPDSIAIFLFRRRLSLSREKVLRTILPLAACATAINNCCDTISLSVKLDRRTIFIKSTFIHNTTKRLSHLSLRALISPQNFSLFAQTWFTIRNARSGGKQKYSRKFPD